MMLTLYVISMIMWIVVWSFILIKKLFDGGAWEVLISFCALLAFPVWPIALVYYRIWKGK